MNESTASMRAEPLLARKGDEAERRYWRHLSALIPHYELFWRYHVFPLRVPSQIWLRDGLDRKCQSNHMVDRLIGNQLDFAA